MRAATHVRVGTQDERVRAKLEHLVPVPSEVECGLPAQRTGQVGGADAQLEAAIPEATDVLERRAESGSRGNGYLIEQVARLLGVIVRGDGHATPEEGGVNTEINPIGNFPLEVGVGECLRREADPPHPAAHVHGGSEESERLVIPDLLVPGPAIAGAQLEIVE